jgi:phosphate transport system permease protein
MYKSAKNSKIPTSRLSTDSLPGVKKRHRSERTFKAIGLGAIAGGLLFLLFIMVSIGINGIGAFQKTYVNMTASSSIMQEVLEAGVDEADYYSLNRKMFIEQFPDVKSRKDKRALYSLVSSVAEFEMKDQVTEGEPTTNTPLIIVFTASDDVDMYVRGVVDIKEDGSAGRLRKKQVEFTNLLQEAGAIEVGFNWGFFTNSDSRDPEVAGIKGAFMGSIFTLLVCLVLSFVVGVMTAIYLEEFARRNFFTNFIEVNINNLAAVPSIIYGLLGLAIFLNVFGMPRSASLVGGLTLALMTLPTIIIASRISLQSVPLSIREAAFGLGATKIQMVFHHVFPLALPGMLTGTIIGMARALGETAPLLMIGMVAFIADAPSNIMDPATTLPVQVYLWADSPERAFMEKTSGAILVLIGTLIVFNLLAVILRKKFEKRW